MDRCSFCGREKKDTRLLIAGISGYICDSCVEQAYEIVM
ncbi:MAG TPA: ClpX C4-type zinc finger protein, partial [Bacteroidales bacterium]|nr:ClpX C4-type zinc finger protein [Bacteroidales bacterium]